MSKHEDFTPSPALAYVLLTYAAFLWGTSTVVGRGVHEIIPPVGLSFWRGMAAAAFLLPFVIGDLRRKWPLIKRSWRWVLFLGIAQMWPQAAFLLSVNFTTAINATLVNASQPAITAVIAFVILRDKLSLRQILGIIAALFGVFTMIVRGDFGALGNFDINIGDIIAVVAVCGWAIYAVTVSHIPRELGLTTTLFLIMFVGSLTLAPFYVLETAFLRPVPLTLTSLWIILGLGIFISATSVFIWNAGLRVVGPNRATAFLNLIPVFGAGLAIIFLGEQLFQFHIIGAVLVCGGIMLIIHKSNRDKS